MTRALPPMEGSQLIAAGNRAAAAEAFRAYSPRIALALVASLAAGTAMMGMVACLHTLDRQIAQEARI